MAPGAFPAVKVPLRVRLNMALRRLRFRLAWKLVRGMDGMVVGKAGVQGATMELAKLQSFLGDALSRKSRLADALQRRVGSIAQLLAVSTEAGNPHLQTQELVMLYAQIRQATMSRREREKMNHLMGVQRLRDGQHGLFKRPPTGKTTASPAQPGKVPQAVLDAMAADHPATDVCPDMECSVCAVRDCPHKDGMHYHHDGCPSCSTPAAKENVA